MLFKRYMKARDDFSICEFCQVRYPNSTVHEHQESCQKLNNLNEEVDINSYTFLDVTRKCESCEQQIPLEEFLSHQEFCMENNKKLQENKKEDLEIAIIGPIKDENVLQPEDTIECSYCKNPIPNNRLNNHEMRCEYLISSRQKLETFYQYTFNEILINQNSFPNKLISLKPESEEYLSVYEYFLFGNSELEVTSIKQVLNTKAMISYDQECPQSQNEEWLFSSIFNYNSECIEQELLSNYFTFIPSSNQFMGRGLYFYDNVFNSVGYSSLTKDIHENRFAVLSKVNLGRCMFMSNSDRNLNLLSFVKKDKRNHYNSVFVSIPGSRHPPTYVIYNSAQAVACYLIEYEIKHDSTPHIPQYDSLIVDATKFIPGKGKREKKK